MNIYFLEINVSKINNSIKLTIATKNDSNILSVELGCKFITCFVLWAKQKINVNIVKAAKESESSALFTATNRNICWVFPVTLTEDCAFLQPPSQHWPYIAWWRIIKLITFRNYKHFELSINVK